MEDDPMFCGDEEAGGHLAKTVGGTRYKNTCHRILHLRARRALRPDALA
jgi:hypothetical protein